jgi:hypothetical protein
MRKPDCRISSRKVRSPSEMARRWKPPDRSSVLSAAVYVSAPVARLAALLSLFSYPKTLTRDQRSFGLLVGLVDVLPDRTDGCGCPRCLLHSEQGYIKQSE